MTSSICGAVRISRSIWIIYVLQPVCHNKLQGRNEDGRVLAIWALLAGCNSIFNNVLRWLEQVTCGQDACVIDWQIPIFLTLMVWRAEEYLQEFQNSRFCMNKAVKALNYWICFSGVQHLEDISLDDFSSSNNYINKNFNWILSQFIQNFVGHIFKTNQVRPCLLFSKISSFYHNTQ